MEMEMGDLVAMVRRRAKTSSYERLNTTSGDPSMKFRVSSLNLNLNLWATLRDAYVDTMLLMALRLDFIRAKTQERLDIANSVFPTTNPIMKQKVTIMVGMECESCRNKALKIASMIKGVSSVAIEGDSKDRVVVTGEDVDTVCLGRNLRKKFRIVTVLTVEKVKPKKDDDKKKKEKSNVVKVCVVPPAHPCMSCRSPTCSGGCKPPCSKCESHTCEGKCGTHKCEGGCKPSCKCHSHKCEPCGKCGSHKCEGKCEPCSKCWSYNCEGGCNACFRCGSYRCHGRCSAVICCGQCPPWPSSPSCCSKPADPCSIQ